MGVVLLPRESWTLISNRCGHQKIRNQRSCRPRIPRALHLCGLFHTRLRFVAHGANFWLPLLRDSCKPRHQSLLAKSTRHHRRWNTTACSRHDSYRDEEHHSKRRADQFCPTFCWKHIPTEINKSSSTTIKRYRNVRRVACDVRILTVNCRKLLLLTGSFIRYAF